MGRRRAPPIARYASEAGELCLPDGSRVPFLRVRDRRARRLRLSIGVAGLRLSVPWRLGEAAAEAFVQAQLGWIAAQWPRWRAGVDGAEANPTTPPATLPLWGETRPATALLAADPADWRRRLRAAYTAEAGAAVARLLPHYLADLPRAPRAFRFRPLRSLWGSLAADGTVSIDLSLVLGPPEAFEYVLVHELCHLIHRDHSPAYWREVEARAPRWREQRGFLRSHEGLALKARCQALLGGG
ncbi:MAG: DUF45 domain-containing protein [Xanthomonadaceae bacterium]|jgi:predicted metal-dependent hydrolase|nr:DUF45 domain-containing protein [Xanthomonadaceae bacterium]